MRTLAEILSGSEALSAFNDLISFSMPSVEKDMHIKYMLRNILNQHIEISQTTLHE